MNGVRLYAGAITFSLEAPSREEAEKRLMAMVGAMKQITPQEYRLDVNAMLSAGDYEAPERA